MIGFWKVNEPFGEFSNWFPAEFEYKGNHFYNSEQAFMWEKAILFDDKVMAEKILGTKSPKECKKLGRKVSNFNQKIFDEVKYTLMLNVNTAKFEQNNELMKLLLSTGNKIICEASPLDTVWGIGMSVDDDLFSDCRFWPGQNLLGKVLMEIRNTHIH